MDSSLPDAVPARLRAFQRLRFLLAGLLAGQMLVGLAGPLLPGGELFPFASWFLFSLVPDRVVSYDLLLHGSESRPLEPPRRFSQAGGAVKSPHSVTVYQVTQRLGRAIEGRRPEEVGRLRREIEAQFARPGMRYEVVRVSYRLAERWKNERAPETVTLAAFDQSDHGGKAP